jgi:hypothetical protein
MRFTHADYIAACARMTKTKQPPLSTAPFASNKPEAALHQEIIDFCKLQVPRWKFIRCRMDLPSSIEVGAHDFTIFASRGRVFSIECKTAKGKLSNHQLGWAHEMNLNEHKVHVVRSMDEFLEVVK